MKRTHLSIVRGILSRGMVWSALHFRKSSLATMRVVMEVGRLLKRLPHPGR